MTELATLVREALAEDIGQADITTNATIGPEERCHAYLVAKQDGVLSGMKVFRLVFELLDTDMREWDARSDGARFSKGDKLAEFQGKTRAVLTGERVALNFVQHLSGIATMTAKCKEMLNGLSVKLCDTRKTTPLLRKLEKEAVLHGGGSNHRYALFDGVLIKENHIVVAGGVRQAIEKALRGTHHLMKIGVEVTTLQEFQEALDAGADAILLDNMTIEEMRQATELARGRKVLLEASGNITPSQLRAIAEIGVHLISLGAITHSAPVVDLSLVIRNV